MGKRLRRWVLMGALGFSGVFLVCGLALALIPAFAVSWLITGNNLLIADLIVGQVGVIAGYLWYDCGGFSSFTQCKQNPPNVAQASASQQPIKVLLKPTDNRVNPDPTKWDPDTANNDVKPKTTIASPEKPATVINSTWPAFLDQYGAPASVKVANTSSTSNSYRDIKTILTASSYTSLPQYDDQGRSKVFWRSSPTDPSTIQVVYDSSVVLTCPNGYTGPASGNCTLSVPSAVKKPSTTPCEVLYKSGSFKFDAANPNCDGIESKLKTNPSAPQQIRQISQDSSGAKEGVSITPNPDGGITFCQDKGSGSTKICVTTGPYDPGQGGYPINGSQQYPGGDIIGGNPVTGTPTPGTGGTGDCSGYGCAKETTQQEVLSGVKKITDGASQADYNALDYDPNTKAQQLVTDLQSKFKTPADYAGITSHITSNLGLPPGGQCSNAIFTFALFGKPMTVDFQWLCVPLAPIVNWFFWVLVTLAAISEVLYILTGRGLPGDNIDASVTDADAKNYIT